jgi:hypothetical protein
MRNQLNFNNSTTLLRIVTHHGREKSVKFKPDYGAWNLAE